MNIPREVLVKSIFTTNKLSENNYQCPAPHMGGDFHTNRLYGGQAVAQAYRAIQEHLGTEFNPTTLHYGFILPGKPDIALIYKVEEFGNGSYRVTTSQNGKVIGTAHCDASEDRYPTYDWDLGYIPDPLDVSPLADIITECGVSKYAPADIGLVHKNIYDIRLVEWAKYPMGTQPRNTFWARFPNKYTAHVPPNCGLQAALLLSDFFIIQVVQDICHSNGFILPIAASLGHSVRFHKRNDEIDPHQWFLFRAECESISEGRAKITAHVYDSSKQAVLSVIQEAYCPLEPANSSKL